MVEEWPYEVEDGEKPDFMKEDSTPDKYKPDHLAEAAVYGRGGEDAEQVEARLPSDVLYHLGAEDGDKLVFDKDSSDTVIGFIKRE